jgi:cytoskeletal protein CcmA (bactofilin family)
LIYTAATLVELMFRPVQGETHMWKWKEPATPTTPVRPEPTPPAAAVPVVAVPMEVGPMQSSKPINTAQATVANIGKSVVIKGELSGSEDLYLDGEVEGSIQLRGHRLTIGPNGRARAHVHAREVVVQGAVNGKVQADERVELKQSAMVVGDILTQRIAIEDGAYFKGAIDIQKAVVNDPPKEARQEAVLVASGAAAGASAGAAAGPAVSVPPQASLLEKK